METKIEEILGFNATKAINSETMTRRFYVTAETPEIAKSAFQEFADHLTVPDDLELGNVDLDEEKNVNGLYFGTITFTSVNPKIKKKIDEELFEVYGEKMSEGRKTASHERYFRIKAVNTKAAKDKLETYIRNTSLTSGRLHINDISVDEERDGAIGFFTGESNPVLRGLFFHVQKWTAGLEGMPGTLQLTQTLPATPVSTNKFRLFKGGKYISSQEVPGLKVSGKQPEFDNVTGTNITGVQIKKASPSLGEGTLTLNYTAATKSLQIKMGNDDYGTAVMLSESGTSIIYDVNENGWIDITVNYASLPTANRTDTFTLLIPKGIFVPNIEAYDAADLNGRTRYYLIGARNISTEGNDSMSGFGVWSEQPTATTAVIQSNPPNQYAAATITLTDVPSNWPLKGFWIHNKTKGDYRFVLNRVGNKLYTKAVENMITEFTLRNQSFDTNPLVIGMRYSISSASGKYDANYNNIVLIGLIITFGSIESKDAIGFLIFNKYINSNIYLYKEDSGAGQYVTTLNNINYSARYTATLTWAANDILEVVSELDVAQDINGATLLDPPDEYTAPATNLQFKPALTLDDRLMADSLEIGEQKAFWVRQSILPNVPAHEAVLGALNFSWY